MTAIVVTMSTIVVLAVAALAFAAFPQRDRPLPGAPWLDRLVQRATDAVPVVGDGDLDPVDPVDPDARGDGEADEPSPR